MRVLIFVPLLMLSTVASARTWTDSSGSFTVEADLVSVEHDVVVLFRDSDKKQIRIPLAKLSKADQEFVKSLGNTPKAAPLVAQPAESKKLRIPSPEEITKAEASVNDLFKKELASRDKNLGKQLLKLAQETKDDNASQYALLRKAIDVGAAAGDTATVYAALESLESTFDVKVLPIWVEALEVLSKKVDVADKINDIIDNAFRLDDYDSAMKLANILLASAKNANDPLAVKNARAKINELVATGQEFKKIAAARQKLATNPTDPEANRVVGSFIGFIKKDWDRAIPMFALGDDASLAQVAKLDLEAKDGVVIGDAWMKIKNGQDRAVFWYKQALPGLTGLTKVRVEKRVQELAGPWDQLDISNAIVMDGFLRIRKIMNWHGGGSPDHFVKTREMFTGRFDLTVVARAEKHNIQLRGPGHAYLIFNWEVNPRELRLERPDDGGEASAKIEPLIANRWYTLRWVVTKHGIEVLVNGAIVFSEKRVSALSDKGPIAVVACDSDVDVKSFVVKPAD